MRTRSSDSRSAVTASTRVIDTSCSSGTTSVSAGVVLLSGELRSMTDVVTSRFKTRSKQGEVIINPMSSYKISVSGSGDGPGFKSTALTCTSPIKYGYWMSDGPQCCYYWGLALPYPPVHKLVDAAETSAVVSEAVTSCWANSRGNSADILTDIAEFDQTAKMLLKPFASVQQYISTCVARYTKKYKRRPTSAREAVTGVWLETRYGIRPLISSIQGVTEALLEPSKPGRKTYRGLKSFEESGTITGTIDFGSGLVNWQCFIREKISVRATLLHEAHATMLSRLGVDLGGLLALPWELVPASFVLDWFVNVGSFLQALGAYATNRGIGSCYTQLNEITNSYSCTSTSPISIRTVARNANCIAEVKASYKDRLPFLGPPSLTAKVDMAMMTNLNHAIDAAALIAQRIR